MQPRTDAELILAARRGDSSSFGELYERYYRWAVGITRSRLSDVNSAEDAAQNAFVEVCRGLATLSHLDRFPQWLTTICRRQATRVARTQRRTEPLAVDLIDLRPVPRTETSMDDVLARLDPLSREIVVLHYFSDRSHADIAAGLGMTPAAVHGRLQRARKKLAKWIEARPISQPFVQE